MTSKLKVNNIEDTSGNALVSKCGTTLTLGKSGDTIALASGASQTGFGRSGSVNWDTTVKTSGFTAESGKGYFCNTTGGAFTVTLPASPSAGDIVAFKDYADTWDSNALTLGRNSSNIGGQANDAILQTEGQSLTFVYVDGTKGWLNVQNLTTSVGGTIPYITATGGTITQDGNYRIHTFTSPGTFSVSRLACCSADNKVSYVVVAGGGAGAHGYTGGYTSGGGGAGGYREGKHAPDPYSASPLAATPCSALTMTVSDIPVTVGAGAASANTPPACSGGNSGTQGSNSVFSTITSTGGGRGRSGPSSSNGPGGPGGSGGGGGGAGSGGSGNTPPVTPSQGNSGGAGCGQNNAGRNSGGGGGGAGGSGGNGPTNGDGGPGGVGVTSSINGTATGRAGGGGGSHQAGEPNSNIPFGGGAGWPSDNSPACTVDGVANKGGGGGGSNYYNGRPPNKGSGAGGSGIVIIRYKYIA